MPLADTLLRLADKGLYLPKWTDEILAEVSRNFVSQFKRSQVEADRREHAIRSHFPEALVEGYQDLISAMTNQAKDRHVLAAAVRSGAELIVTINLRDFPSKALERFSIAAIHPDNFLSDLLELEPGIVLETIREQAGAIQQPMDYVLGRLRISAPYFVQLMEARRAEESGT